MPNPQYPIPNILALIPARGGSKSIPRKNVKLLGGFPLIALITLTYPRYV